MYIPLTGGAGFSSSYHSLLDLSSLCSTLDQAVDCGAQDGVELLFEQLENKPQGRNYSSKRSLSVPSLIHGAPAGNRTLTKVKSAPDVQLKGIVEEFTPEIRVDKDNETYLFRCSSSGLHQCCVTGLVFNMEGGGDVVYRVVPWNRRQLSQHHKQPAGPLFDIECPQQSVCQLHLPHCEIHRTDGGRFLKVAHVTKESLDFVDPQEITETHVVLNINGFSSFGSVKPGVAVALGVEWVTQ